MIGDGAGASETVASSATLGFPPFDAVFNLFLQGAELTHAKAALQGASGRLTIRYSAELRMPVSARAALTAKGPALMAAIAGAGDRAALRGALDHAVETNLAQVIVEDVDEDAATLIGELYELVLDRAAEALQRFERQDVPDDFRLTAALEREIGRPIRALADMGALLTA